MSRKIYAFLAGIGSILVVQPAIAHRNFKIPTQNKGQQELIAEDFFKVGIDLKNSSLNATNSYHAKKAR